MLNTILVDGERRKPVGAILCIFRCLGALAENALAYFLNPERVVSMHTRFPQASLVLSSTFLSMLRFSRSI